MLTLEGRVRSLGFTRAAPPVERGPSSVNIALRREDACTEFGGGAGALQRQLAHLSGVKRRYRDSGLLARARYASAEPRYCLRSGELASVNVQTVLSMKERVEPQGSVRERTCLSTRSVRYPQGRGAEACLAALSFSDRARSASCALRPLSPRE